ncbi:hypothetical protein EYW49_01990 [Siculibacillus lacustris]|uniref:Uncharacterized protein n=1 Tax=Siculibacillus lacustris TaxID=1549641 RepID=A0A4Q9VZ79_9HYPH|nr:hypothetical protein [Siculibacillus lacustris]TBW40949.1 hypothetical protein EYW49_01990 [Siculibacillus lacustris]
MADSIEREVELNFNAFQEKVGDLIKTDRGKFALMRNSEIIGIYDTLRDAHTTGRSFYTDGLFSVQVIETSPVNLGMFSYAVPLAQPQ